MDKKLDKFLSEYSNIEFSKEDKNIFEISGFPHYETVFNNVLAFFLDSSESHNFKNIVYKSLLELLKSKSDKIDLYDEETWEVNREESTDNGKLIDILIKSENYIIGIETKINASLTNDIDDYYNHIEKIKENYKLIIIVVVVTIIAMGIISATTLHYGIVIYDVKIKALVILIYVAIVIIFLKNVSEYNKIEKKIRNIVSGEYQSEIKTDNKYLKNMVQDINNIKKGIENAVNEKVKSERLKTDLITNVSHDLKTPLTSIINYANLLKKENIENENAQKYIEILENKSKKLKNLTEDLIEASKISSGNETVNLQKLNFAEMILQANGEFAEKYESKDLKLISKIEKEGIFAQLDSKKMWRVLENIYNNAYKHSLEGTRIYVNVEQNDKIVFTMKNISKEELNITPEELMERFVRGDKSRTSGGNGLRSFNS